MGLTIRRRASGTVGGVPLTPEVEAGYTRFRGLDRPAPPCFAPEVALNFFVDGTVASCCLGRGSPVGHFPDQTIEEIWQGAAVRAMQDSMRAHRLPPSCDVCRTQLEAHNYSGAMAGVYEEHADAAAADRARPVLRSVEFEISNACNLECVMCNGTNSSLIRRNREQLPPLPDRYGPAFLEQLRPFLPQLHTAKFLGGEPFVVPVYLEIWDALAEVNPSVRVSITTNGTVMNRRVRSVLDRLAPTIVVSLDSVDRAVYEAVRINASLDEVLANVEVFREAAAANGSQVTVSACPMVETWPTLPGVIDYCNERSLPIFFNTVVSPTSSSLRSLGADGMAEVSDFLEAEAARRDAGAAGDPIATQNVERLRGVARQVAAWSASARADRARSVEADLLRELEGWSGRPVISAVLDEHVVLSVDAPPWADRFTPQSWVGSSELELMPALLAVVGTDDVQVELADRPGGVVQADLVFAGGSLGRLRVLRLPHPEHDPSRRGLLLAFAEPDAPGS